MAGHSCSCNGRIIAGQPSLRNIHSTLLTSNSCIRRVSEHQTPKICYRRKHFFLKNLLYRQNKYMYLTKKYHHLWIMTSIVTFPEKVLFRKISLDKLLKNKLIPGTKNWRIFFLLAVSLENWRPQDCRKPLRCTMNK